LYLPAIVNDAALRSALRRVVRERFDGSPDQALTIVAAMISAERHEDRR
jgi:hypothetical protein